MFDYQDCHKKMLKYILIPFLQGALYIKNWLCSSENVKVSDDKDTMEVLEGKLIGKDNVFIHTINDKNLNDIKKGMDVSELTKILCYLEDISFSSVDTLSIDFIYNGEYISRNYKIETDSTAVI